jgi:radical SAM superfamily enzyme YgiQ (UPF0313 family)
MLRIVLATLNARYSHASFGLRYLLANLGPYRQLATLREFTIEQQTLTIVEQLLAEERKPEPTLIGFGVYIWNITETTQVVALLRTLRPDLRIVIGGPEVSFEYEDTEIFRLCDHLIIGEGDVAFRELVADLLDGKPREKVVRAAPPDITALRLPYDEYTDTDLRERMLYVEASRGCPFQCEFCLSSLDERVRAFPLDTFLAALQKLLSRGARGFKFVDRTFNLNIRTSVAILEFCLANYRPGFELHFEMIPDRLPVELRALLGQFPPAAVQLEIGIQSFTKAVLKNISRVQNFERLENNLRFLREETGVHVHSDLIFGLPGETVESFAAGFDQLIAMKPGEIQIGFLKRLRGTPIIRHTESSGLRFSPLPPYEVLQTDRVPFAELQDMKRFARYFDIYYNSGNFVLGMEALLATEPTPFSAFARFAKWLYETTHQTHEFALLRRYELLFTYLTTQCSVDPAELGAALLRDYDRQKVRRQRLEFLRPYVASVAPPASRDSAASHIAHGKRRGLAPRPSPEPLPPAAPPDRAMTRRRLPVVA